MGKERLGAQNNNTTLSSERPLAILFLLALFGTGIAVGVGIGSPNKLRIDEETCQSHGSVLVGENILDPSKANELLSVLRSTQPDIAIIYQNGEYVLKCGNFLIDEEIPSIPTTTNPLESA